MLHRSSPFFPVRTVSGCTRKSGSILPYSLISHSCLVYALIISSYARGSSLSSFRCHTLSNWLVCYGVPSRDFHCKWTIKHHLLGIGWPGGEHHHGSRGRSSFHRHTWPASFAGLPQHRECFRRSKRRGFLISAIVTQDLCFTGDPLILVNGTRAPNCRCKLSSSFFPPLMNHRCAESRANTGDVVHNLSYACPDGARSAYYLIEYRLLNTSIRQSRWDQQLQD